MPVYDSFGFCFAGVNHFAFTCLCLFYIVLSFRMEYFYFWGSVACLNQDCEFLLWLLSVGFACVLFVIHAYG